MSETPTGTEPTNTPAPEAPATPAAPAAPVQLPIEQVTPPAVTPEVPADEEVVEVEYNPTGDAGLDVALAFVGKLGIAGDHPAMVAAGKGDFGLLKAALATLGDKARGWEQMVALGEQAYTRNTEKAATQQAQVKSVVTAVAGDEATWTAVQAWAKDNASPEEKAEINKLFDSGVMGARAAATILVDAYKKASGTVVNPTSAIRAGASATPDTSNGPLSPREYHAAVQNLRSRMGTRMDASPEYAALRSRLRR